MLKQRKIRYFERRLSKSLTLKKLTYFFFRAQFLLIGKNMKNKKGLELVTSLLFRFQNKFWKISLLVVYYLSKFDDII